MYLVILEHNLVVWLSLLTSCFRFLFTSLFSLFPTLFFVYFQLSPFSISNSLLSLFLSLLFLSDLDDNLVSSFLRILHVPFISWPNSSLFCSLPTFLSSIRSTHSCYFHSFGSCYFLLFILVSFFFPFATSILSLWYFSSYVTVTETDSFTFPFVRFQVTWLIEIKRLSS